MHRKSTASGRHAPFTYEQYKYILKCGLESGYRFVGFPELKAPSDNSQFKCCLRHDCDNDLTAAANMAIIEKRMGVRSTYFIPLRSPMYNPMSCPNAELIGEVIRNGHEIGLHFDEHFYSDATSAQIVAAVDWERALLSREFRVQVQTVSFHQPSRRVLTNGLKIGCINAYSRSDLGNAYYVSDTNLTWRGDSPSKLLLERRHRTLQVLIHPEWWTRRQMATLQKWNRMLENNFETVQQSLLKREMTYKHRQRATFVSAMTE